MKALHASLTVSPSEGGWLQGKEAQGDCVLFPPRPDTEEVGRAAEVAVKSLAYGHLCPVVEGGTQRCVGQSFLYSPREQGGENTLRNAGFTCVKCVGVLFSCARALL